MITVIDTMTESANINQYHGLSISEACNAMVLECHEIANAMTMEILLDEHAYLYENAKEIEYVSEGQLTEKGAALKEKVCGWIDVAKEKILAAFKAIKDWVVEAIAKVVDALKARGISKATFDKAAEREGEKTIKASGWVMASDKVLKFLGEDIDKHFINSMEVMLGKDMAERDAIEESGKIVELVKATCGVGEEVEAKVADVAPIISNVLYVRDSIVSHIRKTEKIATKSLDDLKKQFKGRKEDGDEAQVIVRVANTAIKNNSIVAKDACKVYSTLVSDCVKAARQMLKFYNADKMEDAKAAAKAAPGKVADAAKAAPGKIKAAPGNIKAWFKEKMAAGKTKAEITKEAKEAGFSKEEIKELTDLYLADAKKEVEESALEWGKAINEAFNDADPGKFFAE